jgi:hypothetical protein
LIPVDISKIVPEMHKAMRLHAQTGAIENGFVHLPARAPRLDEYLLEPTTFPKSRHDDRVDSTSQALAFLSVPVFDGRKWAQALWGANVAAIDAETNRGGARPAPHRVTQTMIDPVTAGEIAVTRMGP